MIRLLGILLAGIILHLPYGCATKSKQQIALSDHKVVEPTPMESIDIYKTGQDVDRPFKILGKVWTRMQGNPLVPITKERLIKSILPMASEMGADAVFSLYFSNQDDYVNLQNGQWGSGLAIKYINDEEFIETERTGIAVGIRPWATFGSDDNRYIKHLGVISEAAQYFFEKKGYHAVISETPLGYKELASKYYLSNSEFDVMDQVNGLFGNWTEYILLIDSVDVSEIPEKVDTTRTQTCLRATLYSKTLGGLVWENYITADFNLFRRVYEGGRGRGDYDLYLAQVYKKIKTLFSTLPEVKSLTYGLTETGLDLFDDSNNRDRDIANELEYMADNSINYLLYHSVRLNDTSGVRSVLNLGADINSRGYNGNTPLHSSAIKSQYDMTKFLLQLGADANIRNADGKTPLEMILALPGKSKTGKTIQLLENYGTVQK